MFVGTAPARSCLSLASQAPSIGFRAICARHNVIALVRTTRPAQLFARCLSKVPTDVGVDNDSSNKPWHLSPSSCASPSASNRIQRLKHPARGGQDLSNRYLRLERALRGKKEYEREIEDLDEQNAGASGGVSLRIGAQTSASLEIKGKKKGKKPLIFEGFTIPEAPKPPEPDECCMSGCAVCVHDLYAEALDAYEHALDSIRCALHDKGIKEESWPSQLREDFLTVGGTGEDQGVKGKANLTGKELMKAKQASLSAFEQMELQLAARRAQEQNQTRSPSQSGNVAGLNGKASITEMGG